LLNELDILAHIEEETKEPPEIRNTRNIKGKKTAPQGIKQTKNP